jgi:hypothetical protein
MPEKVKIGESVLYQTLQDEVVLLNMSNQHYYGLNETGSRMWDLLLTLPSVAEVEASLVSEFAIDSNSVHSDLSKLVADLIHAGLLVPV